MDYEKAYQELKEKYEKQKEVLEDFSRLIDHKLWVHKGSHMYAYYRQLLNDINIKTEDDE